MRLICGFCHNSTSPTKRGRRASALLTVLLLTVVLAGLGLSLVSSLLSHFSLAVRYRDTAQADACARAGVNEFVYRCQEYQAESDSTAVPPSVLQRFEANPILLEPSQHISAKATLLLKGAYASRDNSLSPNPGQSCFDAPGRTSIPPYSLDVVMKLEMGSRTFLYQALVQQRWPYALTAPGTIRILGQAVTDSPCAPYALSRVKGSVLAFQADAAGESLSPGGDLGVDKELYELLLPYSDQPENWFTGPLKPMNEARIVIGGPVTAFRLNNRDNENPIDILPPMPTRGAKVQGNADTFENSETDTPKLSDEPVLVGADCEHIGQVRPNRRMGESDPRSAGARARMEKLFSFPDTASWKNIQSEVDEKLSRDEIRQLIITGNAAYPITSPDQCVIYVEGGKARFQELALAGFVRLIIDNCSVSIAGNLTLRRNPLDQASLKQDLLVGKNATLIVKGDLFIDQGALDAGGNGMVIMANRFLIRAHGLYRGTIIGREGGVFFGDREATSPDPVLSIRGAVLVGGNRLRFAGPGTALDGFPPRNLKQFTLNATEIVYDAQYLRGLNQYGSFYLQQLIRR